MICADSSCRCLVLVFLALGVVSCGALIQASATPEPRPTLPLVALSASVGPRDTAEFYPTELTSTERGQAIYRKLCVECHGEEGKGNGPRAIQLGIAPSDFTNRELRDEVPISWYFRATTKGVIGTAMLGWESQLIARQRWDVTFYVWSLASSEEGIAQGRRLYVQECAPCHGADGLGDGPRVDTLAKPPTPLADPRYLAGRSGDELFRAMSGGISDPEHDWSGKLAREKRRAIIDYLWTFLYAR